MSTSTELVDRLGALPFILKRRSPLVDIPATKIGPCSIVRGRQNINSQQAAGTLTTTFVDVADTPDLNEIGQLELTDSALDALFGSHTSPAANLARVRFSGSMSDADGELAYNTSHKRRPITYASLRARMERVTGFIDTTGPSTWGLAGGVFSFVNEARIGDNYVALSWGTTDEQVAPALARYTGGDDHRDIVNWTDDTSSTVALMDTASSWYQAVVVEWRNGQFDVLTAEGHRGETAIELTAADIVSPMPARQDASNLVTRAKVSYGDPAATVTVDAGYGALGVFPLTLSTLLAHAADATTLAVDIASRRGQPLWAVPTIRVDLLALFDAGQFTLLRSLLVMEPEQLLDLTGLPADDDVKDGKRYAIQITELIDRSYWYLDLGLVDYALLGPALVWNDIPGAPSGPVWNDVPAGLTWYDASTTIGV